MKPFLPLLVFLAAPAAGQTVYGKLIRDLDTFRTKDAVYYKGAAFRKPGSGTAVRIVNITQRSYGPRTIVVAHLPGGQQVIIDDGHPPNENRLPHQFAEVIRARDTGLSPDELFSRCLVWIGKAYSGSSKAVIDVQDRAAGIIIAKPAIAGVNYQGTEALEFATIRYSLFIRIREGRIRIEQEQYNLYAPSSPLPIPLLDKTRETFGNSQPMIRMMDAADNAISNDRLRLLDGLARSINDETDW